MILINKVRQNPKLCRWWRYTVNLHVLQGRCYSKQKTRNVSFPTVSFGKMDWQGRAASTIGTFCSTIRIPNKKYWKFYKHFYRCSIKKVGRPYSNLFVFCMTKDVFCLVLVIICINESVNSLQLAFCKLPNYKAHGKKHLPIKKT